MRRFVLVFTLAALLWGCSSRADHYDAPAATAAEPASAGARELPGSAARAGARPGEGALSVSTRTDLVSYLGAVQLIVTDGAGNVVAGGEEETTSPATASSGELSLRVPAGDDYTLHLTAATTDAQPTTCRSEVGPITVIDGATAQVQVLAWSCGDRLGYVPQGDAQQCYWLADWLFVAKSQAAVGEEIAMNVQAFPGVAVRWSLADEESGAFSDPRAARTELRCRGAAEDLQLRATLAGPHCEQRITQRVSCLDARPLPH
jgi:hypothetical protein